MNVCVTFEYVYTHITLCLFNNILTITNKIIAFYFYPLFSWIKLKYRNQENATMK